MATTIAPSEPLSPDAWSRARRLVDQERAACARLVKELAKIERGVGATWEREAWEQAPDADAWHLRNCAAIGYAHQQFAKRLDELAAAILARGKEVGP